MSSKNAQQTKRLTSARQTKKLTSGKKKSSKSHTMIEWYKFCEETTIQGFKFIFPKKSLHEKYRVIWAIIWLAMVSLALWLCTKSTQRYFEYRVKTRMYYQKMNEIKFPAITFCNQNMLKRSIAGSSDALLTFLEFYTTEGNDLAPIIKQLSLDKKLCTSKMVTNFSSMQVADILSYGLFNTLEETSEGFEGSVVKCWWENKRTKCDNLFVNHMTDYGLCFSFNPTRLLTYEGRLKKGVTPDDFSEKVSRISGPRSGARILLNVDQKEYCGSGRGYTGAGFQFVIHDPLFKVPLFDLMSDSIASISASPGSELLVSIRSVQFTRYTEHLNKCRSPQYSVFNGTKVYYKTICFVLCHSMIANKQCGCFPNWVEGMEIFFSTNLNVPLQNVQLCRNVTQVLCLRRKDIIQDLHVLCPYCKDACVETIYEQTISLSRFPSPLIEKKLTSKFSTNMSELRKNYVLLHVYFEDMNILNVIESQDLSVANLIMYYGGYTILFMGISFMSFWEIVFVILVIHESLIKRLSLKLKPNSSWRFRRMAVHPINFNPTHTFITHKRGQIFVHK